MTTGISRSRGNRRTSRAAEKPTAGTRKDRGHARGESAWPISKSRGARAEIRLTIQEKRGEGGKVRTAMSVEKNV